MTAYETLRLTTAGDRLVVEHLHATLGERFAPPQLLHDKVSRGELGRKSGLGLYAWPQQEGAS